MKTLKPNKSTTISSDKQLKEEIGKAVEEAMKKERIGIACPNCKHQFKHKPGKVKCPKCGETINVNLVVDLK